MDPFTIGLGVVGGVLTVINWIVQGTKNQQQTAVADSAAAAAAVTDKQQLAIKHDETYYNIGYLDQALGLDGKGGYLADYEKMNQGLAFQQGKQGFRQAENAVGNANVLAASRGQVGGDSSGGLFSAQADADLATQFGAGRVLDTKAGLFGQQYADMLQEQATFRQTTTDTREILKKSLSYYDSILGEHTNPGTWLSDEELKQQKAKQDAIDEAERKRLADEAERKRLADEAERKRLADEAERKRRLDEAHPRRKDETDRRDALLDTEPLTKEIPTTHAEDVAKRAAEIGPSPNPYENINPVKTVTWTPEAIDADPTGYSAYLAALAEPTSQTSTVSHNQAKIDADAASAASAIAKLTPTAAVIDGPTPAATPAAAPQAPLSKSAELQAIIERDRLAAVAIMQALQDAPDPPRNLQRIRAEETADKIEAAPVRTQTVTRTKTTVSTKLSPAATEL